MNPHAKAFVSRASPSASPSPGRPSFEAFMDRRSPYGAASATSANADTAEIAAAPAPAPVSVSASASASALSYYPYAAQQQPTYGHGAAGVYGLSGAHTRAHAHARGSFAMIPQTLYRGPYEPVAMDVSFCSALV